MKTFLILTKRNIKLFFKDKGLFFSSLITPIILLVLYVTFLADIYRDGLLSPIPQSMQTTSTLKLIDGAVGGEIVSSFLAVCCVTIAFSSNFIMVNDKVTGAIKDIMVSPIKKSIVSLSYYFGSLFSTLIVGFLATAIGFIYIACVGWYLSFVDVLLILFDVILLSMFGTALSSIINVFLTTQGQLSAVGTIVSAGYGFVCGAYMPINTFSDGLQNVFAFLPGTYGTSLVRNHCLQGCFKAMKEEEFPEQIIEGYKKSMDCTITFFGKTINQIEMYSILICSIVILVGIYVVINYYQKKRVEN